SHGLPNLVFGHAGWGDRAAKRIRKYDALAVAESITVAASDLDTAARPFPRMGLSIEEDYFIVQLIPDERQNVVDDVGQKKPIRPFSRRYGAAMLIDRLEHSVILPKVERI